MHSLPSAPWLSDHHVYLRRNHKHPGSSAGRESTCNAGDPDLIPSLGSSPGEGLGSPLQFLGFPGGSDGKESTSHAGPLGSIPGLGRSPGGGHGNPLQCSCLEKAHAQRSRAGCSPRGCQEADATERLGPAFYLDKMCS